MAEGKRIELDAGLNLVPDNFDRSRDVSLAARDVLVNELHCGTCDLHMHSAASDGSDSAGELLKLAMEKGLYAISITDRDTMEGVENMLILVEKLYKLGLQIPHFIRGIEISTEGFGQKLDLLAYFPIEGSRPVMGFLDEQRRKRRARNEQMCANLQECGLQITLKELEAEGAFIVGRLHAANILVRKGYAMTRHEAFMIWLDEGRPGYVPYTAPPIEQVIASVRSAHGVPILSSPARYGWLGRADHLLEENLEHLIDAGLLGLEVVYGGMTEEQLDEASAVARNLGLAATAGSGYRGFNRRKIDLFSREMDFSRWIM